MSHLKDFTCSDKKKINSFSYIYSKVAESLSTAKVCTNTFESLKAFVECLGRNINSFRITTWHLNLTFEQNVD